MLFWWIWSISLPTQMIVHNNFNQKTSIPYDVQRSFDGFRCILSRYLDHCMQSEFCILINYPEICNAYGSLVHRQATHTHKKIYFYEMVYVYFKLSFHLFFPPLSLIHNNICIWSVLLSLHAPFYSLSVSLWEALQDVQVKTYV